jgi:hypothetical protein
MSQMPPLMRSRGTYQRHTVGVSASIGRLLRRVARAVACYREQHP